MTNDELVTRIKKSGELKSSILEKALRDIDRKLFVPEAAKHRAYEDTPIPIGFGQTISQPTTVVIMLEMLGVREGDRVLDVGAGSGWTSAILSKLVGKKGFVIGVERIPELVEYGNRNLHRAGASKTKILEAGRELGYSKSAPYDRILVSAESTAVPEDLASQLAKSGVMVIPVKNSLQKVTKNGSSQKKEERAGFLFVKLITNKING